MDEVAGMRLELEGKKMLTIGTEHLELYDPITTKSAGMSCIPLRSASSKTQLIPLYNVLWAKVSNNQIIIDFVLHASRTLIEPSNLTIPLAPTDSNGPGGSFAETFARAILARAYREAKSRKRAYVLINPNSGPGGAIRLWKNEVKPIFDAARMELDVVILSHGGEAAELAEKADLSKYDTIMACSGDGTPHEIFNGLGNRFDASHALASMPVSHIPCGSGNGFSCNLYGSHQASFAALAIVKGIVAPIDLVSVTHGSKRILSFLSQTVGMIAESDLGTEHLRWMGSNRFEWGVLTRIFNRTCYPCDLAVKVEIEEKAGIKAHYRRHASNASLARVASGDSTKASLTADLGLPELKYGTVQSPLPEGWELVSEDSIGIFYAGNMAYMGPNVNFFPASIISDGLMDLVTVDGDLSPVTAIRVMLKTDSPKFFDNPHVKYKKISAYRIIPRNQDDGFISIDGERIPFGPFQAEIHPGLGRVISKDGKYEAEGPANWDKVTVADRVYA
ncbi:ATP-NAD kinase-like domain-containing protein [Dactylonectria estremocensis]|uniref:ATP-NAD kinase-like domain-containing protein n=1 Tax=Dactylonectria estremocensis TaxID=1079267 RepID=A0A9P9FG95_9HYPO|nr:ATP-NAD kinase-like domain-containing protein [Dactylonectria estremocensis]